MADIHFTGGTMELSCHLENTVRHDDIEVDEIKIVMFFGKTGNSIYRIKIRGRRYRKDETLSEYWSTKNYYSDSQMGFPGFPLEEAPPWAFHLAAPYLKGNPNV